MAAAAGAGGVSTLPTLPDTGGNPFPPGSFKEPKRLYCKNGGYFLRILPDGRVDGTREKNDGNKHGKKSQYLEKIHTVTGRTFKLQLQAESIGVISIKGICANRYLAMNDDGRLYGSRLPTDDCFFYERLEPNNYNTYRSKKHENWYVALKRSGQYKPGPKTGPGQKAILFLPMSAKCS
ncbi:fibroblast growth factor 2 isoform X3 [Hypanus sabinus]|uniref:fibroblast growth factor 2 isoform X3 n=1 Tax=Hypanus sabinus TaxID=79690 RepID=UPI0028C48463|nr:fibroblast growth factor 2 isoform X3 [Hypanus sabinus]